MNHDISQARSVVRSGHFEEGLPILEKAHASGNVTASASVAEVFGFLGRWDEVYQFCSAVLGKPSTIETQNVVTEATMLLIAGCWNTDNWSVASRSVAQALKVARSTAAHPEHLSDLERLLVYTKSQGAAKYPVPEDGFADESLTDRMHAFEKAVKSLPKKKPKLFKDHVARRNHIFALATVYGYHAGAVRVFEQMGPPDSFDDTVFLAKGLVLSGREADAWNVIITGVPLWWPVDPVQVAPVELLIDPSLYTIMSTDRCIDVLRTPRGPERVVSSTGP
ncbi:MAG: hypothetical protein H6739_17685 [Alphaproteobacteria bacterium]|nr:hypothetical protein [Alphaproteobacteria bacterium]